MGQKLGLHSVAIYLLDRNEADGRGYSSNLGLKALFQDHLSLTELISCVKVLAIQPWPGSSVG